MGVDRAGDQLDQAGRMCTNLNEQALSRSGLWPVGGMAEIQLLSSE
ncbi:MAG: hypothetical protein L3J13_03740 [Devosiaceae bacterium]|nr:hypothetical protein [Devosiaceae bacterium]